MAENNFLWHENTKNMKMNYKAPLARQIIGSKHPGP